MIQYEMIGWHHGLNGLEFQQALGDGEGQESLECCSPWGRSELDMTERLNNNNNILNILMVYIPNFDNKFLSL